MKAGFRSPNLASSMGKRESKTFREKGNRANSLTFDHQGRLLACERDRVTRTEKDGSVTVQASAFEGSLPLSPNDLVYAIDGSIYFSVIKPRAIEGRDNPGLFQITRNGQFAACLARVHTTERCGAGSQPVRGFSLLTASSATSAYSISTATVP